MFNWPIAMAGLCISKRRCRMPNLVPPRTEGVNLQLGSRKMQECYEVFRAFFLLWLPNVVQRSDQKKWLISQPIAECVNPHGYQVSIILWQFAGCVPCNCLELASKQSQHRGKVHRNILDEVPFSLWCPQGMSDCRSVW
jgi:hypothetical protein